MYFLIQNFKMTQPKQLKEEINNLMKEWMKECAKECCEKCQGIRKGSTGTEYYCLITNCPCHQSPDNSVEGWEGEFEIKYCRGSRGLENKGKPMDKWFFPETLTPFEIKSFIRRLLKDSRSQVAPMGASQWKQHGIKYGYWNFFETMKQTENNILKLVYSLVESDAGFESDSVLLD